jgi:hypothetical protein
LVRKERFFSFFESMIKEKREYLPGKENQEPYQAKKIFN